MPAPLYRTKWQALTGTRPVPSNTNRYVTEDDITGGGIGVPSTRVIATTAPLTGGGDLSADRTIAIPQATGAVNGYLAAADFLAFSRHILNVVTTAINYPATLSNDVIICTAALTVTLPAVATATGKVLHIKIVTANLVTIQPAGAETIDGMANLQIQAIYTSASVISDGANWYII